MCVYTCFCKSGHVRMDAGRPENRIAQIYIFKSNAGIFSIFTYSMLDVSDMLKS